MKDETSYTTIGDEPVEARIVSWVLGEASAFEAAELERLCEERPELLVFRRRMRALHGLLTEAEAAEEDEGWKLPPEKRKALDEIFGEEPSVVADMQKEKRIGRIGRRAFFAIAACVVFAVVVLKLVRSVWLAPQFVRESVTSSHYMAGESKMESLGVGKEASPKGRISGDTVTASRMQEDGGEIRNYADKERLAKEQQKPALRPLQEESIVVGGQVAESGRISFTDGMTLGKAVDLAGGATEFGAKKRVKVFRKGKPMRYDLTKDSIRDVKLQAGDTVEVPQKNVWGDEPPASPKPDAEPPTSSLAGLADGITVPERQPTGGTSRFGDGADFGVGWGGRDMGVAGRELKAGRKDEVPDMKKTPVVGRLFSSRSATAEVRSADEPVRSNAALTYEHGRDVDQLRRSLYKGEGNLNLGKFDEAKKEYQSALGIDPYNAAARRGLERIASAKTDYYRAAYDNTRSELLSQVDAAWELEVPQEQARKEESAEVDSYFDASGVMDLEGRTAGVEYEINTGYSSEYLFRGKDLDGERAKLNREIRNQEDKVGERRKVLATIVRTKGIIYKGSDSFYGQTGVDAQDYVDAKTEFENDRRRLGEMKRRLQALSKHVEEPKPVAELLDIMEEIAASEDPYSTFSLNISDASFLVAQAALDKGEQPDPAGIKVEQFYNAVDYGDPGPSAGEPVAVTIEQCAHPVIPGRNLVRVALKTAAAGRSAAQPLRLTLLVDQSGSMVREDRREAMDKALAGLSELLTKDDRVTVIGFSRTSRLLAEGMPGDEAGKLADLVNQAASEGGTNLEEAIRLAGEMAERGKLATAQNRIVLFTDGAANLGNADPERLAEKVRAMRMKGIAFDIAGIAADGLNDELLGELARNGNGRYYVVGKGAGDSFAKQLAGAFRPAAENVKVQVRFNPERVGFYKLIGFEKDRLKTEDFRNDSVDAAELAAEEAGVAIYQVEALPDGMGELGEVSVRFRDTAAGEMLERSWTIPHVAAPAIDRATPPMQLAVLSMLVGEKLRGGSLGEAIDFGQLAAPRAEVKQYFGNSGRVADMLRMLDALD